MSLRIIAIRVRKELIRWLESNCSDYDVLDQEAGDEFIRRLSQAKIEWDAGIAYEVEDVGIEESLSAILESMQILEYSRAMLILGEYPARLVVDAGIDDVEKIVRKMIPNQDLINIVASDCSGKIGIDITPHNDSYELLVTGAGSSIDISALVEQRILGGQTYSADWI